MATRVYIDRKRNFCFCTVWIYSILFLHRITIRRVAEVAMAGEKTNGCVTNIPYSKSGDRSQDEVFHIIR